MVRSLTTAYELMPRLPVLERPCIRLFCPIGLHAGKHPSPQPHHHHSPHQTPALAFVPLVYLQLHLFGFFPASTQTTHNAIMEFHYIIWEWYICSHFFSGSSKLGFCLLGFCSCIRCMCDIGQLMMSRQSGAKPANLVPLPE